MLHGGIIHEIEFGQEILTGWSPVSDLIGRSMMRWRFVFAGPYFADGYTLGFFFPDRSFWGAETGAGKGGAWHETIVLAAYHPPKQ